MSNDLAIATVTGVLQQRFRTALDDHGLGGMVSSTHAPGEGADPGAYLHLFRVVPNTALQPMSLPTRRQDASFAQRPQLALNLHYQLSFVGGDGAGALEFGAERVAGLLLAELHARPVLSPPEIQAFIDSRAGGDPLVNSDLAEQDSHLRVTTLAMDLEDHSRLWSMHSQNFHALTVALEVSAVLIEDVVEPSVSLPVRSTAVTMLPGAAPVLEEVVSSARDQPVLRLHAAADPAVETLVLRGQNLAGEVTEVHIGDVVFTVPETEHDDATLRVVLDDMSGLQPGVMAVSVVHRVDVDPDPVDVSLRRAGRSGTVAIALVPTVTPGATATDGSDRLVTVALTPDPTVGASMQLLLDGTGGEGHFRGELEPGPIVGSDAEFRVPGLVAGVYLVRVVVDGATSVLDPSVDGFAGPQVTIV